jgi:hypothetical protein
MLDATCYNFFFVKTNFNEDRWLTGESLTFEVRYIACSSRAYPINLIKLYKAITIHLLTVSVTQQI